MEEKQNSGPSSVMPPPPRGPFSRAPYSSTGGGPQLSVQGIVKSVQAMMARLEDSDR